MGTTEKFPYDRRSLIASAFLIANAIVWYFLAARLLEGIINNGATDYFQTLLLWSLHFAALMFSFIVGALLIKRVKKTIFLVVWTLMGMISPLTVLFLDCSKTPFIGIVSILFGISLGLGIPSCMESFTKLTDMKNRGRYSGLVILFSSLGFFSLSLLNAGTIELSVFILIVWRSFGLIILPINKSTMDREKSKDVSFAFILKQRSFLLYLIPWIMFSLVNYLSVPVQYTILEENSVKLLMIVESRY